MRPQRLRTAVGRRVCGRLHHRCRTGSSRSQGFRGSGRMGRGHGRWSTSCCLQPIQHVKMTRNHKQCCGGGAYSGRCCGPPMVGSQRVSSRCRSAPAGSAARARSPGWAALRRNKHKQPLREHPYITSKRSVSNASVREGPDATSQRRRRTKNVGGEVMLTRPGAASGLRSDIGERAGDGKAGAVGEQD